MAAPSVLLDVVGLGGHSGRALPMPTSGWLAGMGGSGGSGSTAPYEGECLIERLVGVLNARGALPRTAQRSVAAAVRDIVANERTAPVRSRVIRCTALALQEAAEMMRSAARAACADGGGAAAIGVFLDEWQWQRAQASAGDCAAQCCSATCLLDSIHGRGAGASVGAGTGRGGGGGTPVVHAVRAVLTLRQLSADLATLDCGGERASAGTWLAAVEACPISVERVGGESGPCGLATPGNENTFLCHSVAIHRTCILRLDHQRASLLVTTPSGVDDAKVLQSAPFWSLAVSLDALNPSMLRISTPGRPSTESVVSARKTKWNTHWSYTGGGSGGGGSGGGGSAGGGSGGASGGGAGSPWALDFQFGEVREANRARRMIETYRGQELERVLAELDRFVDGVVREATSQVASRLVEVRDTPAAKKKCRGFGGVFPLSLGVLG
eukprot:NODE_7089_length_1610_cov_4.505732.p1 GENE.NODE_7089_length_1610_cov_4.505732~~NODE_7089_length_1610_cov_4.505732.p1  ORF type:complete len:483 (+),score=161.29 NODE_7089_length_1610_cov_4.505732:130-1449(+)